MPSEVLGTRACASVCVCACLCLFYCVHVRMCVCVLGVDVVVRLRVLLVQRVAVDTLTLGTPLPFLPFPFASTNWRSAFLATADSWDPDEHEMAFGMHGVAAYFSIMWLLANGSD